MSLSITCPQHRLRQAIARSYAQSHNFGNNVLLVLFKSAILCCVLIMDSTSIPLSTHCRPSDLSAKQQKILGFLSTCFSRLDLGDLYEVFQTHSKQDILNLSAECCRTCKLWLPNPMCKTSPADRVFSCLPIRVSNVLTQFHTFKYIFQRFLRFHGFVHKSLSSTSMRSSAGSASEG